MNQKILITGVTGFAGSFLAEYVATSQPESAITGTYLSDKSLENIAAVKEKVSARKVDLTNYDAVTQLIKESTPDVVYHLAAITTVVEGFKEPSLIITNNATAQINLLEALRNQGLTDTKIVLVSSANVYGKVKPTDLPVDEETPLLPENPYAVSKITQDFIGLQYFLSYNMQVIRLRPFNHLGPRLNPDISVSSFCQQIALIEKGDVSAVLKVGNLNAKRDFTHVKDMVKAYTLAAEKGIAGEVYNLGRGRSYEMSGILDMLLKMAKVKIEVQKDNSRMRPSDIDELRADASRFMQLTDWKPELTIEEMLEDTLEYWRQTV